MRQSRWRVSARPLRGAVRARSPHRPPGRAATPSSSPSIPPPSARCQTGSERAGHRWARALCEDRDGTGADKQTYDEQHHSVEHLLAEQSNDSRVRPPRSGRDRHCRPCAPARVVGSRLRQCFRCRARAPGGLLRRSVGAIGGCSTPHRRSWRLSAPPPCATTGSWRHPVWRWTPNGSTTGQRSNASCGSRRGARVEIPSRVARSTVRLRRESDDRRSARGGRESAERVGRSPATNQPHDEQQQDRSDDRTDQASRLQNAVVGVEPEDHRAKESAEQRTPDTE